MSSWCVAVPPATAVLGAIEGSTGTATGVVADATGPGIAEAGPAAPCPATVPDGMATESADPAAVVRPSRAADRPPPLAASTPSAVGGRGRCDRAGIALARPTLPTLRAGVAPGTPKSPRLLPSVDAGTGDVDRGVEADEDDDEDAALSRANGLACDGIASVGAALILVAPEPAPTGAADTKIGGDAIIADTASTSPDATLLASASGFVVRTRLSASKYGTL